MTADTAARFRKGTRPERNGLRGTTVVLSLVLHLVGFGAAVGLPRLMPRRPPGNPVYVVDLVALPPGAPKKAPAAPKKASARRKAPPKPKPATPKPKPKEQKPIKVPERTTPKEPTAKKPEVKTPEPKPVEPEPEPPTPEPAAVEEASGAATDATPATDGAAAKGGVGVSVGGSGTAGSGASDEYTFYLSLLDRNIRRAWNQPIYTGLDIITATVSLELSRSGRILDLELLTPSGYDPLDRSVIRAVRDAAPFPPFPHFLGLDTLTVQIVFELDPGTLGAGSSGE
jgi:protein TonB